MPAIFEPLFAEVKSLVVVAPAPFVRTAAADCGRARRTRAASSAAAIPPELEELGAGAGAGCSAIGLVPVRPVEVGFTTSDIGNFWRDVMVVVVAFIVAAVLGLLPAVEGRGRAGTRAGSAIGRAPGCAVVVMMWLKPRL